MANSLAWNGTTGVIRFGPGTLGGFLQLSMVAIVKKNIDGATWEAIFGINTVAGGGFQFSGITADRIVLGDGGNFAESTFTVTVADGWVVVGMTRANGSGVTPRFHKYVFSTQTWTHADSAGTTNNLPLITTIRVGAQNSPEDSFFDGKMLIGGIWDVTLTDNEVESLIVNAAAWPAITDGEQWRFDTMSTINSLSGGGSNETSRVNTSLSTDVPTGWEDSPSLADNPPIGILGRGAGW